MDFRVRDVQRLSSILALSGALTGCSVYDDELLDLTSGRARDAGSFQPTRSDELAAEPPARAAMDTCAFHEPGLGADVECSRDDAGSLPEPVANAGVQVVSDLCPSDALKIAPGICGCGQQELDTDGDGTLDCVDRCPHDRAKTRPGICGCNSSDIDTDVDGTADCIDACPSDSTTIVMGVCGCGQSVRDTDGDGAADCADHCPEDPRKTEPGECGCSAVDPADKAAGAIYCVKSQLLHRYTFDGANTSESTNALAIDSVGDDDIQLFGDATQSDGALVLGGDQGDGYSAEGYGALPATTFRGLTNATFEVWFIWHGKALQGERRWQRIFDFGKHIGDNGALRYLYLTPEGDSGVRVEFSLTEDRADAVSISTTMAATRDVQQHIAVVVNQSAASLSLYCNGEREGEVRLRGTLSDLAPSNRWIGRSNFPNDSEFFGHLLEIRIYGSALTRAQLRASASAGPNYAFLP